MWRAPPTLSDLSGSPLAPTCSSACWPRARPRSRMCRVRASSWYPRSPFRPVRLGGRARRTAGGADRPGGALRHPYARGGRPPAGARPHHGAAAGAPDHRPDRALRQLAANGDGTAAAGGAATGSPETDEVARALIAAEADRKPARATRHRRPRRSAERGEAAAVPEDGSDRPAHRRHGARFQQPARRHHRQSRSACDRRIEGRADADELVGEALEAALRGADLTRSLLAFARRQPLQPAADRAQRLDRAASPSCSRARSARRSRSRSTSHAEVWPVRGRSGAARSRLTNLATNARDAMPKGGRLTIATANRHLDDDYARRSIPRSTPGDYAMIEVSDTGTGMSAGDARRRSSSRSSPPRSAARAPASASAWCSAS